MITHARSVLSAERPTKTTDKPTLRERLRDDAGLSTAEYAVGTVAAAGLGGLLFQLLTSDAVRDLLWALVQQALSWIFGG